MPVPSFVIFDTEYETDVDARETDWGGLGHHREIIRIGAAKIIPGQSWDSFEKFDVLVKPVYAPHTPYAENLTGISEQMLERDGLEAEKAFWDFKNFVGLLPVYSNGNDLNKMAETAGLQKFIMPFEVMRFGSVLKPLYRELHKRVLFERPQYPSGRVHELMAIPVPDGMGEVHDAMRDVWSLHVTIEALRLDGADIIKELQGDMLLHRQLWQQDRNR